MNFPKLIELYFLVNMHHSLEQYEAWKGEIAYLKQKWDTVSQKM